MHLAVVASELRLATRNVLGHWKRSAMSVAAIAFGIAALMVSGGFVEWIYADMRENWIHAQLGHVQVVRQGYLESGLADPFAYLLPEESEALRALEGDKRVKSIAPRLRFSGLISLGDATLSFIGEGVDASKEAESSRALTIESGQGLSPDIGNGIILGQGLALNLGVKIGDTLVLLANKRSGSVNAIEVTVLGLFSTVSKEYDDSAIRAPIGLVRTLLGVKGSNQWLVFLNRTDETPQVQATFEKPLSEKGLDVIPWYDVADFYNKTVALFSRQIAVMKVIIGLIIVLSIGNTMTMNVLERTGEIGTALALGVRRRRVLRQIVLEGAVLGFAGAVAGVILGWVLAYLLTAAEIPMPPPPGMARGYVAEVLITPLAALQAAALAIVTTVAASLYPAYKASGMAIVDALRHNR